MKKTRIPSPIYGNRWKHIHIRRKIEKTSQIAAFHQRNKKREVAKLNSPTDSKKKLNVSHPEIVPKPRRTWPPATVPRILPTTTRSRSNRTKELTVRIRYSELSESYILGAAVDIKPPSIRSQAKMKAVTRAPTAASGAPSAGVLVLAVFADRGQQ